jgi:hypothetical protein
MAAGVVGRAQTWLYGLLSTDSQLAGLIAGIEVDSVDEALPWADPETGEPLRYVVVDVAPGNDDRGNGGIIIATAVRAIVKAVGQTRNTLDLDPVEARLVALLDLAEGEIAGGGYVLSCVRQRPVYVAETDENGTAYLNLGGEYLLQLQD